MCAELMILAIDPSRCWVPVKGCARKAFWIDIGIGIGIDLIGARRRKERVVVGWVCCDRLIEWSRCD